MGVLSYFQNDHHECDDLFAKTEQAVLDADVAKAITTGKTFCDRMQRHFRLEEEVLFPAFEGATGMTMGPTQVMRMEHEQMRALLFELRKCIDAGNVVDCEGTLEGLLILMQQHNTKEENILYPMCDMHLAGQVDDLITRMEAIGK